MNGIEYHIDDQQILHLTMNARDSSSNTMNASFRTAWEETVSKITQDKSKIKGIILLSAKKTFFAGGDLNELANVEPGQSSAFFNMISL